jgi:GH25 family lysozyme M1 (1,4-beta-N-acetylmuramidase)
MSKYQELVMDVASYQPSDLAFFKEAANKGVKAVIVKLTEGSENGDHYVNPKAAEQISNAKAAGLLVHGYHYAKFNGVKDAQDEAEWFTKNAKLLGMTAESVMALDIEDSSNQYYATDDANAFIQRVKDRGYPNTDVYSMASWFWAGRLVPSQLIAKNLWVANYGVDSPGLDNVGLWQYTSSFVISNAKVDMSYDFNGFYTQARPNVVPNHQATPTPDPQPLPYSWTDNLGVKWIAETGKAILLTPVNLRWGATTKSSIIAQLPAGSVIQYDAKCVSGGYIWVRQPRANGYGYLAVGEANTNGVNVVPYAKFE